MYVTIQFNVLKILIGIQIFNTYSLDYKLRYQWLYHTFITQNSYIAEFQK